MQQKPIYSNSFKEFLSESDSRICKILQRLDLKDRPSSIVTTKDINYITNRRDGMISYLPSNRPLIYTEDLKWSRKGRVEGRAASVIRKLFNPKFTQRYLKDADFDQFANLYKSTFSKRGLRFELLDNEKIGEVYDWDIHQGGGPLENSCMNGDGEYMGIYEENTVQILALFNEDNLLCGRALVWHGVILDDDNDNRVTFMDRVYTSEDFMNEMFRQYAIDNKWYYKYHYTSGGNKDKLVNLVGDIVFHKLTVKLCTDHDQYPYIDTFCYGGDGWLSNYNDEAIYTYQNTGGDRSGCGIWDDIRDVNILDEDDAVNIERGRYRGYTTHVDNAVEVDGYWYWAQDDDIVEVNGYWYTKDDDEVEYCECDDEWHHVNDLVYSDYHSRYLLYDNAVNVNGEWYLEDDAEIVEIDGSWYRKDDQDIVFCECDGDYHLTEDCVCTEDDEWILRENAVEVGGKVYHKDNVKELV